MSDFQRRRPPPPSGGLGRCRGAHDRQKSEAQCSSANRCDSPNRCDSHSPQPGHHMNPARATLFEVLDQELVLVPIRYFGHCGASCLRNLDRLCVLCQLHCVAPTTQHEAQSTPVRAWIFAATSYEYACVCACVRTVLIDKSYSSLKKMSIRL